MSEIQTLPTVEPGEGIVIPFGFTNELLPGETLAECSVDVEVFSGADPDPQAIRYLGVDLSRPGWALQEVRPTIDGVTYLVRARGLLSSGRPLRRKALLPVSRR